MKTEKHYNTAKAEPVESIDPVEPKPAVAEIAKAVEPKQMLTVRVLRVRGPEKGFRRGGHAFGAKEKQLAVGNVTPEIVQKLGLDGLVDEAQALVISKETQLISLESPVVVELE